MKGRPLSVLVALDDSREARAAVVATLAFPWPASARVSGLVALRPFTTRGRPVYVLEAFERAFRRAASSAEQALRHRWPRANVAVVDQAPAHAILSHAQRTHSDVIVLGSRRRGWGASLLLGSVSRTVVHQAPCAALVVRGRPHRFQRIAVGVDGSPHSLRAVELVRRLSPPPRGEVILVASTEPVPLPPMPFAPQAMRRDIAGALARANQDVLKRLRQDLRPLERSLRRAGWKTHSYSILERPVQALLATVSKTRADALVVGARGVGGIDRLLMGSVAEGVLSRCPVSIVVAR
jgi:nucleotide-binding universal stress UspA family protein